MSYEREIEREMKEVDFVRELAKYPVVRSKSWREVEPSEWYQNNILREKASDSVAESQNSKMAAAPLPNEITLPGQTDFFIGLKEFLGKKGFKPQDVESITKRFQHSYQNFISSLSLDDIERIAKEL